MQHQRRKCHQDRKCHQGRKCNIKIENVIKTENATSRNKIDLNKKNIPRLLTHHGVSLGETLGKLVFQACATLLPFHAVFGDILS